MESVKAVTVERFVKYDGISLWLKVDGNIRDLGLISTRLGGLTHEQKLRAVGSMGKWVRI